MCCCCCCAYLHSTHTAFACVREEKVWLSLFSLSRLLEPTHTLNSIGSRGRERREEKRKRKRREGRVGFTGMDPHHHPPSLLLCFFAFFFSDVGHDHEKTERNADGWTDERMDGPDRPRLLPSGRISYYTQAYALQYVDE